MTRRAAAAVLAQLASANNAPVILLDGATQNESGTFTEGDAATTFLTSATVSDADSDPIASATMVAAGGWGDDTTDELVSFGAFDAVPGSNTSATVVAAGGVDFSLTYTDSSGTVAIAQDGGGTYSAAALQALIRLFTYDNNATPPTETARTFTFVCNDGTDNSTAAVLTVTVAVAPSETAPNLTAPPDKYYARSQTIPTLSIANAGSAGTWSVTSGTLPTGLSLNTSTGDITGTVDAGATVEVATIELTCTNGAGSDTVTFDIDIRTAFTEIDSGDSFPYICSTSNRLYIVTEDITVDGSAFGITATGVVLDLNGHEITYNNSTPITIANHSFENGTGTSPDDWDLTNAPNAERFAGTFLYNEVYDGSYSLKFTDPTATEYAENTTDIVLDANTTYCLSAMVEYGGQGYDVNPGVKMYVQLVGDALDTIEASYSGTNDRGIKLIEEEFTTGGSPETRTVRVGIVGHASATHDVFIDNIKVTRCRTFGVALPQNSGYYTSMADIASSGTATNSVITNGSLTQGQDGGAHCDGIKIFNNTAITVDHVTITVSGNNSSCINGQDTLNDSQIITNNTLTSNVETISRRDYFDGAVVLAICGTITDNTITDGVHGGIIQGLGGAASTVARNTISLSAKYTNGFAIFAGPGSTVNDNVISAYTGGYQCRGIFVASGIDAGNTTKVYNNTISVQQLANNQEYEGVPLGGTYGIQAENVSHTEIYNNVVTAYANGAPGAAMRLGPVMGTNNKVHDNQFIAIRTVTDVAARAAAVKATTIEPADVEFYDNELTTNDVLFDGQVAEMTLLRSHVTGDTAVGAAYPFIAQYAGGSDVHVTVTFADTTFEDPTSEAYFDDGVPVNYATLTATNRFQLNKSWTTTIHAQDSGDSSDIAGATVVVDDAEATEVVNDTTDSNGDVVAILNEWKRVGSTKTALTPHDIAITATGYANYTGNQTVDALNETHTASMEADVITSLGGGLAVWGFAQINNAAYQHSNKAMTGAGNYVAQVFEVPKSGTIANVAVTIAAVTSAADITVGLETLGTDGLPTGSNYGGSTPGSVTGAYTAGNKLVALGTAATATRGDRVALVVRWSSSAGSITVATLSGNSASSGFPYVVTSGTQSRDTCICGVEYNDGTWPPIAGGFPANDIATTSLNIDDDASGPQEAGLLFRLPVAVRAHGLFVCMRPLGTTDTFQCHIRSVVDGSTLGTALASTASTRDDQTSATSFVHGHFFLFTTALELDADTDYRLVVQATGSRTNDVQLGWLGSIVEAAAIEQVFNVNSAATQWDGSAWTDDATKLPMMALVIDGM